MLKSLKSQTASGFLALFFSTAEIDFSVGSGVECYLHDYPQQAHIRSTLIFQHFNTAMWKTQKTIKVP